MHIPTWNYVKYENRESEVFLVKDRLQKGVVLNLTLFITIMDDIIKEIRKKTKQLREDFRNLKRVRISECAFIDDVVMCAAQEK